MSPSVEGAAYGSGELVLRDRSFKLRLDSPVCPDEEDPWLRRKAPLLYPAIEACRWIVVLVDLYVDEPDAVARFCRSASTTSTTGPHVLLVQNSGVAKTATNGLCSARLWAIE